MVKNRILPENPKRDPLDSLNVFYKPKTSNNSEGYFLTKFKKLLKKESLGADRKKRPKGDPLISPPLLEAIKNYGLVRDANPRSPASLSLKISRPRGEQMNIPSYEVCHFVDL